MYGIVVTELTDCGKPRLCDGSAETAGLGTDGQIGHCGTGY